MNYLERPSHTRLNNQRSNTKTAICHSIDDNISKGLPSMYGCPTKSETSGTIVSSLTGLEMKTGDFTHNNMVPFFGGSLKQNVDSHANSARLESFTGVQNHRQRKEEIKPMFNPTKGISHVHGTPHQLDSKQGHYIPSLMRTSETPIKKVMVGPGINSGYDWKPSGGLNQDKVREVMLPKTVDQLRAVNNPKTSYEGRVITGKSNVDKRQLVGKIEKRAPNTYYKNDPSRYNTTVGAVTRQASRAKPIVKSTGRNVSRQVIGAAGPAATKGDCQRPDVKKSNKVEYQEDSTRNLGAPGKKMDDLGKESHWAAPNERDITGTRTHTSNLTNLVKAIIAPVQDLFKTTRKEETCDIENFGQINGAQPKPTVYDPNDTTRTTIKETNIHNTHSGQMARQAPPKTTVHDQNDIMRTTIKETNIHNSHSGQMAGPKRLTLYDPNDIARTTIKETNIHHSREGTLSTGHHRQPAYDPNDMARTTIKETNIHNSREGTLSTGHYRQPAYDPNDVTRTTIKETNIHDKREGMLATGHQRQPVYDPSDVAKTTIKETNIHNSREGALTGGPHKLPAYDPNDLAKTTIKETNIHNNREGDLATGHHRQPAYDPNDIAKPTIKETNIHHNREGAMATGHQKLPVYDPNDLARTTIKETNIHDNREGALATGHQKLPVYDPNDLARTTIKETNIHDTREGALSTGHHKLPVYDPNDVAKTTIKETNIHDVRTGNLDGQKRSVVYDPDDTAKVTIRNTLCEEDKNINLQGMNKPQVHDPDEKAKTTIRETTECNSYEGQVEAKQTSDGYRVKKVTAKTTNRETTDDYEYAGVANADVQGGGGQGYLTANPDAPVTNRQFTSDQEYSGVAKGESQPISYDNIYNATLNDLRELTLEGREPTNSNRKKTIGAENVQIDIKKMECDLMNQRDLEKTAVVNHIPVAEQMGEMTGQLSLDNDCLADRNNPELIKAFIDNPYTHSLTSH